jgi:hypothetical protein
MQRICCFITCPPFSVFEVFHSPRSQTASSQQLSRLLGLKSKSQNPFDILGLSRASKQVRPGTTHDPSAVLSCTIHVLFHIIRLPPQPPSSKPQLGQAPERPAFRKLAAKLHPDIAGTGDAAAFRQVLWVALTCFFFFPNQTLNLFQQDVSSKPNPEFVSTRCVEVHEVPGH